MGFRVQITVMQEYVLLKKTKAFSLKAWGCESTAPTLQVTVGAQRSNPARELIEFRQREKLVVR